MKTVTVSKMLVQSKEATQPQVTTPFVESTPAVVTSTAEETTTTESEITELIKTVNVLQAQVATLTKQAKDKPDVGYVKKEPTGTNDIIEDSQSPDGGNGKYDGGYADPLAKDGEDDLDDEECVCEHCGSKYKAKKAVSVLSKKQEDIQFNKMSFENIDLDAIFNRTKMARPTSKAFDEIVKGVASIAVGGTASTKHPALNKQAVSNNVNAVESDDSIFERLLNESNNGTNL